MLSSYNWQLALNNDPFIYSLGRVRQRVAYTISNLLFKDLSNAIQEALGHTDIKTTESYLGSFERDTKKRLAQILTAFKVKELKE